MTHENYFERCSCCHGEVEPANEGWCTRCTRALRNDVYRSTDHHKSTEESSKLFVDIFGKFRDNRIRRMVCPDCLLYCVGCQRLFCVRCMRVRNVSDRGGYCSACAQT